MEPSNCKAAFQQSWKLNKEIHVHFTKPHPHSEVCWPRMPLISASFVWREWVLILTRSGLGRGTERGIWVKQFKGFKGVRPHFLIPMRPPWGCTLPPPSLLIGSDDFVYSLCASSRKPGGVAALRRMGNWEADLNDKTEFLWLGEGRKQVAGIVCLQILTGKARKRIFTPNSFELFPPRVLYLTVWWTHCGNLKQTESGKSHSYHPCKREASKLCWYTDWKSGESKLIIFKRNLKETNQHSGRDRGGELFTDVPRCKEISVGLMWGREWGSSSPAN